jgi:hypothetical protein
VLACAATVAGASALFWSGRARPLQQLTCLGGVTAVVAASVAEIADPGPVGLAVWATAAGLVVLGRLGRTTDPVLTMGVGAASLVAGGVVTVADWQGFGALLTVGTALALLAVGGVRGLVPDRAARIVVLLFGGVGLLWAGPSSLAYFAQDGGIATGAVTWAIGAGLVAATLVDGRRLLWAPRLVETAGGVALLGGAAITAAQRPSWATVFGIGTGVLLLALGAVHDRPVLSAFGAIGLLVNVPWAVARFFPGEGRVPLLVFVTGALVLAIAVWLTRDRLGPGWRRRPPSGLARP